MIIKCRDIVETKAMVKNDRVRKTNLLALKGRMTLLKAFTKDVYTNQITFSSGLFTPLKCHHRKNGYGLIYST